MAGEVPTCQQFAEPELQSSSDPVATTFSDTLPRFAFHPIPKEGSQSLKCLELQQAFLDNATGYDKEKRKKMSRYPGIHWYDQITRELLFCFLKDVILKQYFKFAGSRLHLQNRLKDG